MTREESAIKLADIKLRMAAIALANCFGPDEEREPLRANLRRCAIDYARLVDTPEDADKARVDALAVRILSETHRDAAKLKAELKLLRELRSAVLEDHAAQQQAVSARMLPPDRTRLLAAIRACQEAVPA